MELFYSIKKTDDFKAAFEVMVFAGLKKGIRVEKEKVKRSYSIDVIKTSINLLEQNLFNLLVKEKRVSQDYSQFTISKDSGKKVLQALFMTCKLVYQDQLATVVFDLKELVSIQQVGNQLHFYLGKEKISSSFLYCIPDLLIQKGSTFFHYQKAISKKLVAVLDQDLAQSAIDEIYEDYCDEIEIILKKQKQIDEDLTPIPCLRLKDRTGAFANLGFYYGKQLVFSDEQSSHVRRNRVEEKLWEEDLLKTGYIKKMVAGSNYYCGLDKVAKSLTALMECGWEIVDTYGRQVVRGNASSLEFKLEKERLHLEGKINFSDQNIDLLDVYGAFCRRQTFLELGNQKVGLIDYSAFFDQVESDIEITPNQKGLTFHKGAFFQLKEAFKEADYDQSVQYLMDEAQGNKIVHALTTSKFTGVLFPYQKKGLEWIYSLYMRNLHGLLADDMGLGKTVQVIAFLSAIQFSKALIVLPTTLLYQWEKEFQKFYPDAHVTIFHGKSKQLDQIHDNHIILTTYGMIREYLKIFKEIKFDILILDEAQIIKTRNSQIFEAVSSLKSLFRLSMTGTPIENSVEELITHYEFLLPGLIKRESLTQVDLDFFTKKRIKNLIRPFFLRRKKQEVLQDLPEKIEQMVYVSMDDKERISYETTLQEIKANSKEKVNVLEAILKLRQHCCLPQLVRPEFEGYGAKFDRILNDILDIVRSEQKVIVYSSFITVLEQLRLQLRLSGIEPIYLDGSTQNRQDLIDAFQNEIEKKVFLISLKAGGVGLNLTAADYVLIYDPWWNDAAENQAIDRAHRIGRSGKLVARRYILHESIEEKILSLKLNKSKLYLELIDNNSVSSDELKFSLFD